MTRLLSATALLALAVTAAFGGTQAVNAARPHQTGLVATVTAFGYAAVNGPGNRADTFATPALLTRAPARHVINLMGPAQVPPQSFTFRVDSYAGNRAGVAITWKYGTEGNVDSTTWVSTSTGWKLDAMRYVRPLATRNSLVITNHLFMHALNQGGRRLNSYATASLLRQANGQLISFYGFQNSFRSATLQVNSISGGTAQVTQRFNFGSSNIQVRSVTWTYTPTGWKVSAIAAPGRG